jgi:hypothetical protein
MLSKLNLIDNKILDRLLSNLCALQITMKVKSLKLMQIKKLKTRVS